MRCGVAVGGQLVQSGGFGDERREESRSRSETTSKSGCCVNDPRYCVRTRSAVKLIATSVNVLFRTACVPSKTPICANPLA